MTPELEPSPQFPIMPMSGHSASTDLNVHLWHYKSSSRHAGSETRGPNEHAEVPQHGIVRIQLMSEVVLEGPWIHEVVPIPVHVHQLDSIGNDTRQTRQRVSSHQQSKVGVDGPRRGVRLCVVQSTRVHEWTSALKSPYR
ncbi:uncharacterized protein TNCV_1417661 [Trichonephila clavipes]|nr:uncharacterized protein TNCV_1417661 [Trichonephila clavipes]